MMRVTDNDLLQLARTHLLSMCGLIWPQYDMPRHIRILANHLEAVERGEINRLMIFMPPRHGKTQTASIFFPAWYLGRNPERSVIFTTYQQDKANDVGQAVQNVMTDDCFRAAFPECSLSASTCSKHHIQTMVEGDYFAVGAGGAITGRGANLFLIDDPIKGRKDAESALVRNNLKEWFTSVAYTRLEPKGAVVLILTRWQDDDLAGWLLKEKQDEKWVVLSMPALDDAGAALWPERFDANRLTEIHNVIGEYDWESLYQQRPSKKQGNILHREWWNYWDVLPPLDFMVQSWDMAFKKTSVSDFVVGQVWGAKGADRYLIDQVRARMDFNETIEAFRRLSRKWPKTHTKYVEDKANGPAVIDTLKREISGIVPVDPGKKGNKLARATAITPQVRSGNVYLPQPESNNWVYGLVDRCATFRGVDGDVDDEVDAMTQALSEMDSGTAERLRRLLRM